MELHLKRHGGIDQVSGLRFKHWIPIPELSSFASCKEVATNFKQELPNTTDPKIQPIAVRRFVGFRLRWTHNLDTAWSFREKWMSDELHLKRHGEWNWLTQGLLLVLRRMGPGQQEVHEKILQDIPRAADGNHAQLPRQERELRDHRACPPHGRWRWNGRGCRNPSIAHQSTYSDTVITNNITRPGRVYVWPHVNTTYLS